MLRQSKGLSILSKMRTMTLLSESSFSSYCVDNAEESNFDNLDPEAKFPNFACRDLEREKCGIF